MRYLEFACASNFSFLRGASHPEELMLQGQAIGLAGLGLCDRNSVAGVVRAHLAKREQNLSLTYHPGARLTFADGTPDILAYPRDRAAWGRLTRLLTVGNLRAEKGDCILRLDDLLAHAEGLELVVMQRSTAEPSIQSFRGARAAREPGIHTPQHRGYGFRVRGLTAAPRNDDLIIRIRYHSPASRIGLALRSGKSPAASGAAMRRRPNEGTCDNRSQSAKPSTTASGLPCRVMTDGLPRVA